MRVWLTISLVAFAAVAFFWGRRSTLSSVGGKSQALHSRPSHYGLYVALWSTLPALIVLVGWLVLEGSWLNAALRADSAADIQSLPEERTELFLRDAHALLDGDAVSRQPDPALEAAAERLGELRSQSNSVLFPTLLILALGGFGWSVSRLSPSLRARQSVEATLKVVLAICSTLAILTTAGIVLSLIFEAIRFFQLVPVSDFLFGTHWSPQTALRTDQVGSSGAFGAIPVFAGTLLITVIAMSVAVPVGLFAAVYLAEYASQRTRTLVKPALEMLAGIPTVVYGFFAALTVGPMIRGWGDSLGLSVSSESALAAGLIMGVMIIPFVSSLSDDVISAVPQSLREGSLGLGATPSETIRKVVLPAALPGIVAAVLLAVSRAIGETMIVVMAAGLSANLTANPFAAVTTVTVQIVTLLVGDQEFDSAKTLAAFALGLVLFIITLILNVASLFVVRRYREQYD